MNSRQLVGFVVGFAAVILVLSNLLWFEYVRDLKDDKYELENARSNEYINLRNQLQIEKERMKTEIDLIESEKKELEEQKHALEAKLEDIRRKVEQFAAENGRDFLKVLDGENSIFDPFGKNPDLEGKKASAQINSTQETSSQRLQYNPLANITHTEGANATSLERALTAQRIFLEKVNRLQFPKECKTDRLVICSPIDCGFGCILHHYAYCLVYAYAQNKTMIFAERTSKYGNWLDYFEPESSCEMEKLIQGGGKDVIRDVEVLRFRLDRTYIKYTPEDILEVLEGYHKKPQLWFIGQIVAWLLRPNQRTLEGYNAIKKVLKPYSHPMMGGTDKGVEAPIVYLDKYIPYAQKQNMSFYFLATDDRKNVEIAESYKNLKFIMFPRDYGKGIGARYDLDFLILEMYMLSFECDFFFGTDASQISRACYEMMQTKYVDGTDLGWSIHTILADKREYFFWYFI